MLVKTPEFAREKAEHRHAAQRGSSLTGELYDPQLASRRPLLAPAHSASDEKLKRLFCREAHPPPSSVPRGLWPSQASTVTPVHRDFRWRAHSPGAEAPAP